MKLLDMAIKEIRQSTRSLTAIMFMFVVPILVTALFAFMFGGVGEGESFTLPQTAVVLVNLDEGELPATASVDPDITGQPDFDLAEVDSMGALLAQILQGDAFVDLLTVTLGEDAAAARTAVDNQTANVALIIPPNFTDSLMLPDETATIELYHDPTLSLGPAIVASLLRQFTDSFAFTKIGTSVAMTQLAEAGVPIDEALVQGVVNELTAAAFAQAQTEQTLVTMESPPGTSGEDNLLAEILGQIMGGMMIFFAFFTGAGTLQTILVEAEKGTLSRLFTTPTPVAVILGGKVLGTLIMLTVQVTVLMFFGRLVFGIQWGSLGMVVIAAASLILIAAATGLFLASLVKNTRQSGAVYGGVLTLTGMIGMISIFTGGAVSPTIEAITLVVPQGWAVRGLQTAMQGGSITDLLPTLAGLLVWMAVFVAIAQYRLQRRFV
ncbi:MAG: ABC transporter permease [Chloroflexi bacterium]|nr:ABC transporter permease [Chloroflexota bacterium]